MTAEIITVCSLKGGVGKTTVSYALCAAAASEGKRVIAIDLDPTGGLSNALEKSKRTVTIADVLQGKTSLRDALIDHPLGIKTVAGHRSLNHESLLESQLRSIIRPVREEADIILLDTHPHEQSLLGPLAVGDRIVIPTALDMLSLRAAALTVGLAQKLEALERIRGIAVTNAKRPLGGMPASLLHGLTASRLAFETVLWFSSGWIMATSGRGELPDPLLLEEARKLLAEVHTRSVPVRALTQFITLAQGKRGGGPGGGRPALELPPLPPPPSTPAGGVTPAG